MAQDYSKNNSKSSIKWLQSNPMLDNDWATIGDAMAKRKAYRSLEGFDGTDDNKELDAKLQELLKSLSLVNSKLGLPENDMTTSGDEALSIETDVTDTKDSTKDADNKLADPIEPTEEAEVVQTPTEDAKALQDTLKGKKQTNNVDGVITADMLKTPKGYFGDVYEQAQTSNEQPIVQNETNIIPLSSNPFLATSGEVIDNSYVPNTVGQPTYSKRDNRIALDIPTNPFGAPVAIKNQYKNTRNRGGYNYGN